MITLEQALARIDAENLTNQINVVRGEDRWQVSMRRPGNSAAYRVIVNRSLLAAMTECLCGDLPSAKRPVWSMDTYWYHPESESWFRVPAGEALPDDGLSREITKQEYDARPQDDDDYDDLI